MYVNGQSKIIERDIGYQGGVAFGVADVLLPPGVAGRCDEISYEEIKVRLGINKVSWTFRKDSFELIELSSINKVS